MSNTQKDASRPPKICAKISDKPYFFGIYWLYCLILFQP